MDKFIINGGKSLKGTTRVSGSKNVALKALVAACLTDQEVVIHNIPRISDVFVMAEIIEELGGKIDFSGHTAKIRVGNFQKTKIELGKAALIRTSALFLAPLVARMGEAHIPNPGGCRIGARPIDRIVEGLRILGANVDYLSEDGYFHINVGSGEKLKGAKYRFDKNTHTGTETLIMASVLASGTTVLENAAEEPEVDDLISLLNAMGADIKREGPRRIVINGVERLGGAEYTVSPDRNEIVTLAIAAVVTKGDVFIEHITKEGIEEFLEKLNESGGGYEEKESGIRFFYKGPLKPTNVTTNFYTGFMTDWQAPWAILMTQAEGESTIHETVYESRFGYVEGLRRMGCKIELFNPEVANPQDFYNFNWADNRPEHKHAARIYGPTKLHNGIVQITDLRAGASLVIAGLAASGTSVIYGVEYLDRGYEEFEKRLNLLGADIRREKE